MEAAAQTGRFVWGCKRIARELGHSENAVYRLMERGELSGARKVGGRWCFAPAVFARTLEPAE